MLWLTPHGEIAFPMARKCAQLPNAVKPQLPAKMTILTVA